MSIRKPIVSKWKALIVTSFLIAIMLSACEGDATSTLLPAEEEDIVSSAVDASELYSSITDSTDGEELFLILCTKCHGLGGLGDGPSVGSLSVTSGMNLTILQDRTDEELMETITVGKGIEMPAWGLILTRVQREALMEYVRTLGQ